MHRAIYRGRGLPQRPGSQGYQKGYLKPLGNPGQIELFKTNIFNTEDIKEVLNNCDIAINLVGILYETRKQNFVTFIHNFHIY